MDRMAKLIEEETLDRLTMMSGKDISNNRGGVIVVELMLQS